MTTFVVRESIWEIAVVRPVAHEELRVRPRFALSEDVSAAIAQKSACPVGEMRVGEIRLAPDNQGMC